MICERTEQSRRDNVIVHALNAESVGSTWWYPLHPWRLARKVQSRKKQDLDLSYAARPVMSGPLPTPSYAAKDNHHHPSCKVSIRGDRRAVNPLQVLSLDQTLNLLLDHCDVRLELR